MAINKTPKAIGPYTAAREAGGLIYTSGQIPVNPETGDIVAGGIEEQAAQALANLKNVIEAAGGKITDVIKTTVYLKSMGHFSNVNSIYADFFKEPFPARTCIEVSELPKGALIEIEAVVAK